MNKIKFDVKQLLLLITKIICQLFDPQGTNLPQQNSTSTGNMSHYHHNRSEEYFFLENLIKRKIIELQNLIAQLDDGDEDTSNLKTILNILNNIEKIQSPVKDRSMQSKH